MRFLLQKNIWHESDYQRFIGSVEYHDIACEETNVVPFTTYFDPEVKTKPDHSFGSTRFVNICRDRGFYVFPDFAPIDSFYPVHTWVNGEGRVTTWGELKITKPVFIKPFTTKFFTGKVVKTQADLDKIQLSTSFIEKEADEKIWVSAPVDITDEIRFFVVGEHIVTGSYYRIAGKINHIKAQPTHAPWTFLKEFLRRYGCIADGFVIDVGLVGREYRIIELNNLNSSGLYKCDTDALVLTLSHFIPPI